MAVYKEKIALGKRPHRSIVRIVDSRVTLMPHLEDSWQAFWTLNTSRAVHFGGLGAIPLVEVQAYAGMMDYDAGSDDLQDLVRHLRVMDDEYLLYQQERRQAEEPAPEKPKPQPKVRPRGNNRTPSRR